MRVNWVTRGTRNTKKEGTELGGIDPRINAENKKWKKKKA